MTTPRLLLEAHLAEGAKLLLSADEARYLTTVLRRGPGDPVHVFSAASGEFEARLLEKTKAGAAIVIGPQRRPPQPQPDLRLLFAPLKRGPTDMVVEKATELGVAIIQPVFTQRTVAETVRLDRWAAIAKEAAEQSERLSAPALMAPLPLPAALQGWDPAVPLLFADETRTARPLAEALPAHAPALALLTGPEGGFDPAESRLLRSLPFVVPVSLGPLVLRAETAVLAALAVISALWRPPAG